MTPIVRTEAIALARFDHEPHIAHRDPDVERASSHALSFVESGSFRVRVDGAWRDVTPRHMCVTSTGMECSCAHEGDYPDDCCLSVRYTDEAVESLRRDGASVATETCYSVGFGSLSHFVTTYRRHFGVRPSHGRPPR